MKEEAENAHKRFEKVRAPRAARVPLCPPRFLTPPARPPPPAQSKIRGEKLEKTIAHVSEKTEEGVKCVGAARARAPRP